jgi:uncharacterized protein YjbJ (UPF0337 family)
LPWIVSLPETRGKFSLHSGFYARFARDSFGAPDLGPPFDEWNFNGNKGLTEHRAISLVRRTVMGSTTDKVSGVTNEAIGKAKQGIGEAVGSAKLKGEGHAQEVQGQAQKAAGDVKAAVKNVANKAADAANRKL